ncbi:MAG: right-handed parallel beta-helix repeat-containing protein [Clostridia bacterium]|nr:right-handed parallel beta-helix repeat-containing protein [Clostridia bacterium]
MKTGFKKLISVIFVLCICANIFGIACVNSFAVENSDIVLYVSPDATEDGAGALTSPISLTGAKALLKTMKSDNTSATVYLLGGTYYLDKALCFNEKDMANVTYKAYNNQEVVFSGAYDIKGFEESEVNGVKVFTKKLDTSVDNWYFKSLFSDNGELSITRFPEEGYFTVKATAPEDDLWTEDGADRPWEYTLGQRSFYANTEDIPFEFHNSGDVNIRILHYWHDELMNIKSFDKNTGKIGLSRPSSMTISDIDRYYFENVFEALNEPGEWYLDSVSGILYYVPKEGEKADELTLYGSTADKLVDINGIDGISFEGVRFTRTDWTIPKANGFYKNTWWEEYDMDFPQAAICVEGVVSVEYAKDIHFKNCEFTDLGGTAVKMKFGVKNSSVENCYFENIAATAIYVGGENCLPEQENYTENITIKNNEIYKYGRKFFCAIGIHITFCDTAEVVNNEIHDGYYTGISCGWIWGYAYHATKNIKISRNLIYNIGQGWLSDMGGIYMLGKQPGTVLSENVIHNVAADPGEGGYGGWGIYLDEGSSFMSVEKNLVYSCGSQGLNIHYGEGNVIRNNISALSAEGQVNPGPDRGETHAVATYYNNIFLTSDKVPVYVNMLNPSHFYDNGNVMWSITEGDELYFVNDENSYTLKTAQDNEFIHNPVAVDPCFKDALNFDFTLAEDSPAFATNFEAWDYSVAGTVKDSVIGLNRVGGQTAYNDEAHPQPMDEFNHSIAIINWLHLILAVCAVFAVLWLIIGVVKGKKTLMLPVAAAVLCVPCFVAVYFMYLEWIEILYFLSVFLLAALAAVLPTCVAVEKGKAKKSIILAFVINFILSAGIFLGLAGIMNMLLSSGSPEVISIACGAMIVYMIVNTIRLLKVYKKK